MNIPLNNEDYPHHPAIAFCKEDITILSEGLYESVNIDIWVYPTAEPHKILQMFLVTNEEGHLKEVFFQTIKKDDEE